jgi:2-polyprenyl-6-methoxyphenol hydroxylase-like FAD-dependent oxidoreductase
VGAGPAGLYLSVLLKLSIPACDITVYERRQNRCVTGWGVTFGQALMARLDERDEVSAARLREAALFWEDQVIHISGAQVRSRHVPDPLAGSYNISRQRMLDVLSDRAAELGVRIDYGHEIRSLSELPDADLIVAADGVGSQIREEAGGFGTQDAWGRNKYIWLGLDKALPVFSFFYVPTPAGWIWAHAYGIDPETSTFIVECTPETWAGLGFDALSTDEALPVLEELFAEHVAGHRLLGDLGDGSKARWLNFRTISNQRWHSGNVVLAGDSAHTAHFAIGMGTTLALEDAIALADSLQQHASLQVALLSYETRRLAEIPPILAQARLSARWFEDVLRYINLKPHQFGALFYARRSPIVKASPPRLSYVLLQAAARISAVNVIRAKAAAAADMIASRRHLPRRVTGEGKEPA